MDYSASNYEYEVTDGSGASTPNPPSKYQPQSYQPAPAQRNQDAAVLEALTRLEQRIGTLEEQNAYLRSELSRRDASPQQYNAYAVPPGVTAGNVSYAGISATGPNGGTFSAQRAEVNAAHAGGAYGDPVEGNNAKRKLVATNSSYGYKMLDHAERTNDKPLLQLEYLAMGELDATVTISGGATVIMDYQRSNRDTKFGWLMRHPTSRNQIGKKVSEALLHEAKLAVTAPLSEDFSLYGELLYNPQQSFGAGTITDVNRNQMQLRRGWIMWGNLNKSPAYALIGKMDVPFGLNDTVSPFTNSTNWHSFAGLAYGAQLGVAAGGFHGRVMAVQGGAQFRGTNTPVNDTNVPSRLNNFAVDGRYRYDFNDRGDNVMVGGSYLHGTSYCLEYPVMHFNPCSERVPAWSAYGKLQYGPFQLLGEYASTTKVWPGTQVPDPTNPLSEFEAVKTKSFTIGSRFGFGKENDTSQRREFAISGEFSKFIAGDKGAPWERQNQIVLGASWYPRDNINLFTEVTHVDGWVPLNFLSGGNQPGGGTWSERDANTDVLLFGVQVAF